MNLQELTSRSVAGDIDEINLVSLEGDIYVLEARMGARFYPVHDEMCGMDDERDIGAGVTIPLH